jgi:hypothetical protein
MQLASSFVRLVGGATVISCHRRDGSKQKSARAARICFGK